MVRETLKSFWKKENTHNKRRSSFLNRDTIENAPIFDQFEAEALRGSALLSEEEFNDSLRLLDQKIDQRVKRTTPKTLISWPVGIAAMLSLMLISTFAIYKLSQKSTSKLAKAYFKPFPNVLAPITRGENADNALSMSMQLYESGQFQKSADQLEPYLNTINARKEAYLYLGIAHLAVKNHEKSLKSLSFLYDFPVNEIKEASYWYSLLAYLSLEDKKRAAEMAREVIKLDGFYKQNAQEILDAL